ncbi:MAG: DNA ligase [Burkholderiales bacterium]
MPNHPSRRITVPRRALLIGLAGSAWLPGRVCAEHERGASLPMLLARELPPRTDVTAYLVSEKFDGVRAQWDGHSLRFRGGGTVPAPASILQRLPAQPLDGELWLGRGRFEALAATVRTESPNQAAWRELRYLVFELPGGAGTFEDRAGRIQQVVAQAAWPQLVAVAQTRMADRAALQRRLDQVVRAGGEGLMLHRADAPYLTGRSDVLLKFKPLQDAEAEVVAHLPGQGRHAGRLGALRVRTPEGALFNIGTGFSDAQRTTPPPVGASITYTYRGRTAKGLPRFASYLRPAEPL